MDQSSSIAVVRLTQELTDRFIAYLDVSASSAYTYKRSLRRFSQYLSDMNITEPTRATILQYRDSLRSQGLSSSTIQSYMSTVRQFFQWTAHEQLYPNIAEGIKGAKVNQLYRKDALTAEQAHRLTESIDRCDIVSIRNYAIIVLMLTTGLRSIELVRLNIEDMRYHGGDMVLYVQGKGEEDKAAYIKLVPDVEVSIRQYLHTRSNPGESSPLFASCSDRNNGKRLTTRSISRIAKTALREAGLDSNRLTAHSLRHTAGTLNLLGGGTIDETQQLLRHSKIATTMIYLHHLSRDNNDSEMRIWRMITDKNANDNTKE